MLKMKMINKFCHSLKMKYFKIPTHSDLANRWV